MYKIDEYNDREYNKNMHVIKKIVHMYIERDFKKTYKKKYPFLSKIMTLEKYLTIKHPLKKIFLDIMYILLQIIKPYVTKKRNIELALPNYFSKYKIVVYTCIFGKYDTVTSPLIYPDNIDYYIVTDQIIEENTGWKVLEISKFEKYLSTYNNIEKNRWIKMHPHEIFPNYKYSVYIDGNIIPATDFTEFVNRIGKSGIAMYNHAFNDCVYHEAFLIKYIKPDVEYSEIKKHVQHLKKEGMPKHFGMTSCNVIARDHENRLCIKVMEIWWDEFMKYSKRDQMSFTYSLWKNGLSIDDVGILGEDAWNTGELIILNHN